MDDGKTRQVSRAASNILVGLLRFAALFFFTIFLFPFLTFERLIRKRKEARLRVSIRHMRFWARVVCRIVGYRVHVIGQPEKGKVLYAPNHQGYADIFALASVAPCFFVPKGDMASWPLVGFMVRQTGHVFSSRRRAAKDLKTTASAIAERLKNACPVCVFLEGASTGGDAMLPFRPSFLQAALDTDAAIQPVAIRYFPKKQDVLVSEDVAYWRPEHDFLKHIIRHLGLGKTDVQIIFCKPIDPAGHERKALAVAVQAEVEKALKII
ncbi:MAG: lysophospholipid acyltransferase family protein [Candidatus Sumerlaeia bacterium]